MTKELDKIRAEIDKIDGELYRGLERRLGLVRSLAGLKRTQGREDTRQRENLFRPAREASLIGKLLQTRARGAEPYCLYLAADNIGIAEFTASPSLWFVGEEPSGGCPCECGGVGGRR